MFRQILIKFWVFAAMALMLLMPQTLFAQTVGVAVNQSPGDASWGAHTDIPFKVGATAVEFTTAWQGGDAIRGKSHLGATFPVPVVGRIKIYADSDIRGAVLSELGAATDVGVAFVVPDVGGLRVEIGVFGRNSNPYGVPSALDILGQNRFDVEALDPALAEVKQPGHGFSMKAENSLNLRLATAFAIGEIIEVKVAGMPEVSRSENRVHQLVARLKSGWELGRAVSLNGIVDVGAQTFKGLIEYDYTGQLTLDYDW